MIPGKNGGTRKNMSQRHFVHHKSGEDWVGSEPGPQRWKAGHRPSETCQDLEDRVLVQEGEGEKVN